MSENKKRKGGAQKAREKKQMHLNYCRIDAKQTKLNFSSSNVSKIFYKFLKYLFQHKIKAFVCFLTDNFANSVFKQFKN